jgi:hypothetical protein
VNKILLKTTILHDEDDWHIGRFSLLSGHLESMRDGRGRPLFSVTARDRTADSNGDDPDLVSLPDSDFDELWLFAVDVGAGLSQADAGAIRRFTARGGGLLFTRDHHDVGACLLSLDEIGRAHFFNSANREPEKWRHCVDDVDTREIEFPNYHSGRNGDLQLIEPEPPLHVLLRRNGVDPIVRFPSHPHEGVVGIPEATQAYTRVIAKSRSRTSGRQFNSIVAFDPEAEGGGGRAVAHSSFHHFADYNWDPRLGCPSFVQEPEGDQVLVDPHALDDIRTYVDNLARWLSRDLN